MPCSSTDLRNPQVGGANVYGGGFITDSDGAANINVELEAGRLIAGADFIDLGTGISPRLRRQNGLNAEVHLILRSHGMYAAGRVAEQVGSGEFVGCPVCFNQQAVMFLPVR